MKKRAFTVLGALCLLVTLLAVLGACVTVHKHTYAGTWTSDNTHHWHAATCEHTDEVSDKAEHTWDEGTVTTAPTETEEGVLTRTCTVCGKTGTFAIPSTSGHTHSYTASVTAPTCTEQGYTTHTCACGDSYKDSYTEALGHNVAAWTHNSDGTHTGTCSNAEHTVTESCSFTPAVTAPTCTEQGYTTYTCVCGYSYRDDYKNATGHSYKDTYNFNDSEHWREATCAHTTETTNLEKHSYTQSVTAPTCTERGYTTYTCACGYSYKSDYVDATGHDVQAWTESSSTLYGVSSCKYEVIYQGECNTCHNEQTKTEYIEKHSYYWAVTKPATCDGESGIKTKVCNNEGCQYHSITEKSETQSYTDPEAHAWVVLSSTETTTVYQCDNCSKTKTVKVASENSGSVKVDSSEMNNVNELEFSDITIGFDDQVMANLSKEENLDSNSSVSISAGTLKESEKQTAIENANLSPEDLALLGNNPIYSFTVTGAKEISELGGTATVRIPYTLTPGQNPDQIVVWYISNDGLQAIPATYAKDANGDGYITFTTTHFSHYAPAELTPESYCKAFGHSKDVYAVAPTCTEGGYTICLHCGQPISYTPPTGHTWHSTVDKSTSCTDNGVMHFTCADCDASYDTVIPTFGHLYVLHDHQNATCQEAGSEVYKCIYCQQTYTVSIPQLSHSYTANVVAPTCTERGYTEKLCKTCGDTITVNYTDALGHTFSNTWYSAEEGHYHVCTVCGERDELHAHTPGAPATEQSAQICTDCEYVITPAITHTHQLTKVEAVAPDCTHGGNLAYYTCSCGKWFLDAEAQQLITDHASVILTATGHTPVTMNAVEPTCTEGGYTAGVECSVCHAVLRGHAQIDAYGHRYTASVTAPTCTDGGYTVYTCDACDNTYTANETDALGHNYVSSITAPTCTDVGYTTHTCTRCNDSYTDGEKAALGHNYASVLSFNKDAHWYACTRCEAVTGYGAHTPDYGEATTEHGITCTDCGYVIEEIKEHTHSAVKSVSGKEPSCTSSGIKSYYICSCGEWFEDAECTKLIEDHTSVILPMTDHNLTSVPGTQPTCQEIGYTAGEFCETCKTWLSGHKELPLIDHIYENGSCTMCGKAEDQPEENPDQPIDPEKKVPVYIYTFKDKTYYYTYEFYSDYTVYALAAPLQTDSDLTTQEAWAKWETADDLICLVYEDKIVERFTVSDDNKTLVIAKGEDAACEHKNTVTSAKDPTCTESGSTVTECLDCGEKWGQSIAPLGHSFGTDGVCIRCGEAESDQPTDTELESEKQFRLAKMASFWDEYCNVYNLTDHANYATYLKQYNSLQDSIENATSLETIETVYQKFEAFCKNLEAELGIGDSEEQEELKILIETYAEKMDSTWETYLAKTKMTSLSNYADLLKRFDQYYNDLRAATTLEEAERAYSQFQSLMSEIDDALANTSDAPAVLYTYTDAISLNFTFYSNNTVNAIFTVYNDDGSSYDTTYTVDWEQLTTGEITATLNGELYTFSVLESGELMLISVSAPDVDEEDPDTLRTELKQSMTKTWRVYITEKSIKEELGAELYETYNTRLNELQTKLENALTVKEIRTISDEFDALIKEIDEALSNVGSGDESTEDDLTLQRENYLTMFTQTWEKYLNGTVLKTLEKFTSFETAYHDIYKRMSVTASVEEMELVAKEFDALIAEIDAALSNAGSGDESTEDEVLNEKRNTYLTELSKVWDKYLFGTQLKALEEYPSFEKRYNAIRDLILAATTEEEFDNAVETFNNLITEIDKALSNAGSDGESDENPAQTIIYTYTEDGSDYHMVYTFYSDYTVYGYVEFYDLDDGTVADTDEAWANWETDGEYILITVNGKFAQSFTVNEDSTTLTISNYKPEPEPVSIVYSYTAKTDTQTSEFRFYSDYTARITLTTCNADGTSSNQITDTAWWLDADGSKLYTSIGDMVVGFTIDANGTLTPENLSDGEIGDGETDLPTDGDITTDESYDFGGETVTILIPTTTATNWDMLADEPVDLISKMIFERNIELEERLNVYLEFWTVGNNEYASYLQNATLAGDCEIDIISHSSNVVQTLIPNGIYADLKSEAFSNLQLDAEWWNGSYNSTAGILGKQFTAVGDVTMSMYDQISVIYFNLEKMEAYALEDIYTSVLDGMWTMETLNEYVNQVYMDLNADDTTGIDDALGLIGLANGNAAGFLQATGGSFATYNESENNFTFACSNQLIDAMERLTELWNTNGAYRFSVGEGNEMYLEMGKGNTLFMTDVLNRAQGTLRETWAENDIKYGIVPLPKFNEDQAEYQSGVSASHNVIAVLGTDSGDMVCAVLNTMGQWNRENLIPAYQNKLLANTYASEVALEVLDLTMSSAHWDILAVYDTACKNVISMLWETPFQKSQPVVTQFAMNKEKLKVIFQEFRTSLIY